MVRHRGIHPSGDRSPAMDAGAVSQAAPVAQATTPSPCWVRNVTQDTHGRSFAAMVAATVDGDRLRVKGSCLARQVSISTDVVISGVGDGRAVLDAGGRGRVLGVRQDAMVTLRRLAITGGQPRDMHGGGGIYIASGTMVLSDSVVRGNVSPNWGGGGITNNGGVLTLVDSVVRGNTAYGQDGGEGGGIVSGGGLTLVHSVVRGNIAYRGTAGGIDMYGTATLTDSVVRGNHAGSCAVFFQLAL